MAVTFRDAALGETQFHSATFAWEARPVKRTIASALLASLTVSAAGCGGGVGPSSNPAAASPIKRGLLLISQTSDALYGTLPTGLWRIKIPIEVKAMNAIPLDLNYARLTIYDAINTELLRLEVSANDIIAQAGSNHVSYDHPLRFTLVFEYPPRMIESATLLLHATDANGNGLDASLLRSEFHYSPDPEAHQ